MIRCVPVLRTGTTAVVFLMLGVAAVRANPASLVPSAADPGDPADLHLSVDYAYSVDEAVLYRESAGDNVDPLAPLPRHRDLAFKQFRHLLTPRADLGVFHDTWLSFALPIVIAQER